MVQHLVTQIHVKSVQLSMEFYQKLGFGVRNEFTPDDQSETVWAWMRSENAHIMLALADEPVIPSQQAAMFYLYIRDVESTRKTLLQKKIACGEISFPFYAERGIFRVVDPDGYALMMIARLEPID